MWRYVGIRQLATRLAWCSPTGLKILPSSTASILEESSKFFPDLLRRRTAQNFSKSHGLSIGGELGNFQNSRTHIERSNRNFVKYLSLFIRGEHESSTFFPDLAHRRTAQNFSKSHGLSKGGELGNFPSSRVCIGRSAWNFVKYHSLSIGTRNLSKP